MEFWDYVALREDIESQASRAERDGWDGLSFPDSQNMMPDVYVCLTLAARVTEALRLSTAVTNPVTRHPNVSACAALTLHSLTARAIPSWHRARRFLASAFGAESGSSRATGPLRLDSPSTGVRAKRRFRRAG